VRRFVAGLSVAYLLALVAVVVAIDRWGDSWWPVVVVQYLPRIGFALPLPLLALFALRWRSWIAALSLSASVLVLLFPLMRLNLGRPRAAAGPTFRLATFNVYFGWRGEAALNAEVAAARPDVLVLQASNETVARMLAPSLKGLTVKAYDEYLLASRFAVKSAFYAPPLGPHAPAQWVRFTLDTPLGLVDLFVVHPFSPRRSFQYLEGDLRTTLKEGPPPEGVSAAEHNMELRRRQIDSVLDAVAHAEHPVILAGDTNLTGLGPLDRALTERLSDGWKEVGWGFGYTFPAHRWRPWMRLDRVLTGPGLQVTRMEVIPGDGSDHAPVVAQIASAAAQVADGKPR
jgi:endonuclease/exonuclease/phosphatase (EEP) superfamily protein YafD